MPSFDPLDHSTPAEDLHVLVELARLVATNREEPTVALEVGSWAGLSTLVLSEVFDMTFCVDHWRGTKSDRLGAIGEKYGAHHIFTTFCQNMGDRLHRTVFPCAGFSQLWAIVWRRPLDLVFLDADHTYLAVYDDICAWRKHVRPGGILCGHDYGSFEGVTKAVDYLLPERQLAGLSMWYAEVPR